MISCPNKNLRAWKNAVKAVGEDTAYLLWDKFKGNIPKEELISKEAPSDAKFKIETKPEYTLEENPEALQRFVEKLKVGDDITFEYWSPTFKERTKRRLVRVMSFDLSDGSFVGNEDGDEKRFLINNIVDRTNILSNRLSAEEIEEFKNSLEIDKTVTFFDDISGNVADRALTITSINDDNMVGVDIDTEQEIVIPFNSLLKRDSIDNDVSIATYVKKVRRVLAVQLKNMEGKIKDANDQDLYNSILESQNLLNDYKGIEELESLYSFLKEIDTNIKKIRVLIDNIENQGGDIPSQLRRIGLLKDFVDGHKGIEDILNPLRETAPDSKLNDVIGDIIANIHSSEKYYFTKGRPKLAKWLYDHMNPELNEKLKKEGMEIITVSSLEDFLSNPKNDLTWIDTFLVASSNVNDSVTGLFSLALKRMYSTARRINVMYKEHLMPLFSAFSKQGYKGMIAAYRKMFFYQVIQTEKGPIAKRRWVTEYNDFIYYDKVNLFNRKIKDLGIAALQASTIAEAEGYRTQSRNVLAELQKYKSLNNVKLTFAQAEDLMNKLKVDDNNNFRKKLNNSAFFKLLPITEKTVTEGRAVEPKNAILVDGRYYAYTGNMQQLKLENFKNDQYDKLKQDPEAFKMYEYLYKVYTECEKKLPMNKRLGGYIPAQGKSSTKEDIKEFMSLDTTAKRSQNLVKLDGDVYKEIPLYFEKPNATVLDPNITSGFLDGDTDLINDDNIDNNVIKAVLNYAAQANMYDSLNKNMGAITFLLDTVKDNAPKNPDGSNIGTNRRYDKCQNLANQLVFGELKEKETFWTRLVDILGKITSFINLGFSPAVYINNFIMGNMANIAEAVGERNFTKMELLKANKEFFSLVPDYIKDKQNSKLHKIITRYDAIQGEFNNELTNGFGSFLENLKENNFYAFTGSNIGELEIQGTSLIALMMNKGLWEKFDENGDPISPIDPKEEEHFTNVLHELNKSNHGVYNDFDRLYYQPNAFFRLMLQFRKYVVPTYRAKWYGLFGARDQAKRIDMESGEVEQGYYASFRFFLEDNWRKSLNLPYVVERFNELTPMEKEGVRRSLHDIIYIAAATMLLAAILPDDDEDESGFLAGWTALSLRKSVSEVSSHIPLFGIQDQLRQVSSPFVAAKSVANLLKLLSQTCGYDFKDSEWKMFEQYDRKYGDYEAGDYKIEARFNKVLPIYNIIEAGSPNTLLENFEKASRV